MRTKEIQEAVRQLRSGGLVAIPTETVYGLAALASDDTAVKGVFSAKARPFFDPLIVHIGEWSQLENIILGFSNEERILAERFWPGPLTIVTKKKDEVSALITSGLDTVAVRMPNHPLTLELLRALGEPVVAPSANQFGRTSPTDPEHVESEFPEGAVLILDGGKCTIGIESTVVQVSGGIVSILRPGGVTAEQLREALFSKGIEAPVERRSSRSAPGHLEHHYQPRSPLVLTRRETTNFEISEKLGKTCSVTEMITLPTDPVLAARSFYADLRQADRRAPDALVLRWSFPEDGLWEAIWDRASKAATVVMR